MHMLRHYDVTGHGEVVMSPRLLQRLFEDAAMKCRSEFLLTAVATEGDEVKVSGLLVASETCGHGGDTNESGETDR